jgi:hypothetical protein
VPLVRYRSLDVDRHGLTRDFYMGLALDPGDWIGSLLVSVLRSARWRIGVRGTSQAHGGFAAIGISWWVLCTVGG